MKAARFSAIILALFSFIIFIGCDNNGGGTESVNRAPVISAITASLGNGNVDLGETSTLSVSATDADGDSLTFSWDASDGNFDIINDSVVVWTAPEEANQCEIIAWVSDGIAEDFSTYSFEFSSFAPGPPTVDSIFATPAHLYIATAGNQDQWYMELFARITDANGTGIIRVTAELPSGTILNLRDDAIDPDPVAGDNEWNSFPGSYTMVIEPGWVNFTAVNQYYEEAVDSFYVAAVCDTLPSLIPDSTLNETNDIIPAVNGEIFEFSSVTPNFRWFSYTNADNYEVWVTKLDYTPLWEPDVQLTDTSAVYNFDGTGDFLLLYNETEDREYILHLKVNRGNAWAKREQVFRRVD